MTWTKTLMKNMKPLKNTKALVIQDTKPGRKNNHNKISCTTKNHTPSSCPTRTRQSKGKKIGRPYIELHLENLQRTKKKRAVRVNKFRSKLDQGKGGLWIIYIAPFWMGGKISWLGKLLQKEYNEAERTNNQHNQQINGDINNANTTEDWLKMLINELSKISGDVSLTPIKNLTGWGTQKIWKYGLQLKTNFGSQYSLE